MPQSLLDWLEHTRAGDFASIGGVLLSLGGFWYTIQTLRKTKSAAEAAKEATTKLREKLAAYDSIATISAAITAITEIHHLHLDGKWVLLPDRYIALRQSLIAIRAGQANLTDAQAELLQGAIQQFSELERQVDKAIVDPGRIPDRVKLNRTVSAQADRLMELLTQLRAN